MRTTVSNIDKCENMQNMKLQKIAQITPQNHRHNRNALIGRNRNLDAG